MNRPAPAVLQPRKIPRQARSSATIEAILTASIQVLLAVGVGRLTTTLVAQRAGVSVGTLYQYFPHKQALLFAVVERQFVLIEDAMSKAAERLRGQDLRTIAQGLASAWLDAKMADIVAARAIYGIAAEFDLSEHMGRAAGKLTALFGDLLASSPGAHFPDRDATAFMLTALLGGAVRVVMESADAEQGLERLRQELPRACYGYMTASTLGAPDSLA